MPFGTTSDRGALAAKRMSAGASITSWAKLKVLTEPQKPGEKWEKLPTKKGNQIISTLRIWSRFKKTNTLLRLEHQTASKLPLAPSTTPIQSYPHKKSGLYSLTAFPLTRPCWALSSGGGSTLELNWTELNWNEGTKCFWSVAPRHWQPLKSIDILYYLHQYYDVGT